MKTRFLNNGFVSFVGASLLTIALILVVVAANAKGKGDTIQWPHQRDFGTWSYVANKEPNGEIEAHVQFDYKSVKGIQDFAATNKTLANQLAKSHGSVEVEVTFRRLMDPDAYRTWGKSAGISRFDTIELFAEDALGPYVQVGVTSRSSDPLPKERFAMVAQGAKIRGVHSFRGIVDVRNLQALAADHRVFVVDVTMNIVRDDLRTAGLADVDAERVNVRSAIYIYGEMEKLGLENFR